MWVHNFLIEKECILAHSKHHILLSVIFWTEILLMIFSQSHERKFRYHSEFSSTSTKTLLQVWLYQYLKSYSKIPRILGFPWLAAWLARTSAERKIENYKSSSENRPTLQPSPTYKHKVTYIQPHQLKHTHTHRHTHSHTHTHTHLTP